MPLVRAQLRKWPLTGILAAVLMPAIGRPVETSAASVLRSEHGHQHSYERQVVFFGTELNLPDRRQAIPRSGERGGARYGGLMQWLRRARVAVSITERALKFVGDSRGHQGGTDVFGVSWLSRKSLELWHPGDESNVRPAP